MVDFEIRTLEARHAAVVRGNVAMAELSSFFGRAFGEVMAVVGAQGLVATGPPFGYYPRMPTETVEVAAGFPIFGVLTPSGEVTPFELPGGRAVVGVHVGPFEGMQDTYRDLFAWVATQGEDLGEGMWESYLTDPTAEPDQSKWRTEITWPLS